MKTVVRMLPWGPNLVFTCFKKNAIVAISGFTELVYERKIVLLNGEVSWRGGGCGLNITWSNLLSFTECGKRVITSSIRCR